MHLKLIRSARVVDGNIKVVGEECKWQIRNA